MTSFTICYSVSSDGADSLLHRIQQLGHSPVCGLEMAKILVSTTTLVNGQSTLADSGLLTQHIFCPKWTDVFALSAHSSVLVDLVRQSESSTNDCNSGVQETLLNTLAPSTRILYAIRWKLYHKCTIACTLLAGSGALQNPQYELFFSVYKTVARTQPHYKPM